MWWVYGDPEDPEVAERFRKLREQAKAEYGHRECVRCSVRDAQDASTAENRQNHPSRYYGLHPVFEPQPGDV